MSSPRKNLKKFLRAARAAGGNITLGTAPSWNLITGEYEGCLVSMQAGDAVLLYEVAAARGLAQLMKDTPLDTYGADLIEMAEIAERMNAARPTTDQALADYYGPSEAVH